MTIEDRAERTAAAREIATMKLSTTDLDELEEFSGYRMDRLSRGRDVAIQATTLGDVNVALGRIDFVCRSVREMPGDAYTFLLKRDDAPGFWNGIPASRDVLTVYGPGGEHEGVGGHEWASLTVSRASLERQLNHVDSDWRPPPPSRVWSKKSTPALLQAAESIADAVFTNSLAQHAEEVAGRELADLMVDAVDPRPPVGSAGEDHPTADAAIRIVQTAVEFIAGEGPPVEVGALASAIGISDTWLRSSFKTACGVTPKRFIQMQALNSARRDLLRPDSAETVTDVAMRWGFWHLGRFAADYRSAFGELPGQTLQARATEPDI